MTKVDSVLHSQQGQNRELAYCNGWSETHVENNIPDQMGYGETYTIQLTSKNYLGNIITNGCDVYMRVTNEVTLDRSVLPVDGRANILSEDIVVKMNNDLNGHYTADFTVPTGTTGTVSFIFMIITSTHYTSSVVLFNTNAYRPGSGYTGHEHMLTWAGELSNSYIGKFAFVYSIFLPPATATGTITRHGTFCPDVYANGVKKLDSSDCSTTSFTIEMVQDKPIMLEAFYEVTTQVRHTFKLAYNGGAESVVSPPNAVMSSYHSDSILVNGNIGKFDRVANFG